MLLELDHVTRSFSRPGQAEPLQVLKDASLCLESGQSVAVMGPSGSGKSTLLNILGGLDRPDSGSVKVAGRDLATLSDRERAAVRNRSVGFVFQLHHLLPQCSVLENVLVPTIPWAGSRNRAELWERARQLLASVGLEDRLKHRPGELSGGECQRVAVARALINRPSLLLADEPTGSLDAATAAGLADLLVRLNREEGTALVVVTHSATLAGAMDRVLLLRDGRLCEAT